MSHDIIQSADNEGLDHPVHPRSLLRAFTVLLQNC